ncbi:MAG: hypothetical protein ABI868_01005 [Acidobacteriota bacterium]
MRHEIERILRELGPTAVVGSAACGSDLLVLEAAAALRIRRRIILPFERARFRATSVTDRPGDWGSAFDAIVKTVAAAGDLVELSLDADDAETYLTTNGKIFDEAEAVSQGSAARYAALVLWNGATRGTGDVTGAFLSDARARGWPVREIDTASPSDHQ